MYTGSLEGSQKTTKRKESKPNTQRVIEKKPRKEGK
jgi:hypothetical protein